MSSEENEEKQSLKESTKEILVIIKVCLTSFWFWLPTLFAIFLYVELYLLFVNPLLFLIGPIAIIIYALIWEEKRLKAQYDLKEVKIVKSSDPLFTPPRRQKVPEVDQLLEEYKKLIKRKDKKGKAEEKPAGAKN
ncbi:MAG: hypothetical protein QXH40_01445 [Candidatus Bathyarchaeia archaeon]